MAHDVFISYSAQDKAVADDICSILEADKIRCWIAPRDVMPGTSYGDAIIEALSSSKLLLLIHSSHSDSSYPMLREVAYATGKGIPIMPYLIEDIKPSSKMSMFIGPTPTRQFDGSRSNLNELAKQLVRAVRQLLPLTVSNTTEIESSIEQQTSKGYVFISYVRSDQDFVEELRSVLKSKRYGYWDYVIGNRDYHGKLFQELEERIDGAVAFMTIVSDQWRESEWVAAEFIYARECQKPIFVIQAKTLQKPFPILLNLQTRIDMSRNFEKGAQVLVAELAKERL